MPLSKKIISLITLASLVGTLGVATALTISPARAELTADPGETISDSFIVINEQDTDQTYYTSVENFDSQGETGTPNFTTSDTGLPTWVKIDKQITLKKGERLKVPYSIEVPKDADAGGHFAAIFLSTVPPTSEGGEVSVGAKVGMLVLLRVTGNVKETGGLLSFVLASGKKVMTSLPLDFVYRFNNTGNDRVKPEGTITINNMIGGEVAKLDANSSLGNVLPGSVRRYEVHFGDEKGIDANAPFMDQVKYQMNNFALGMYTAHLDLKFGNSGSASSSLTYFMFPWQLLTLILVGLVVVVLVLAVLLKKYNQWIIKQARSAR